jgi:16S rRNA (guanine966-N2)-methyltransferase
MQNQVRIIAGKWRQKKISFLDGQNIRPTPSRSRETIFNWLAPIILDATCLDLFAGSGIMGFEALSRGAKSVYFNEKNLKSLHLIKDHAKKLTQEKSNTVFLNYNIPAKNQIQHHFDVVFLDPSFNQNLIPISINWLVKSNLVSKDTYIVYEAEKPIKDLYKDFVLIKEKKTKETFYGYGFLSLSALAKG